MSHFHGALHWLFGCSPERHGIPRSEFSHDGIRLFYRLCPDCGRKLAMKECSEGAGYTLDKPTAEFRTVHGHGRVNSWVVFLLLGTCPCCHCCARMAHSCLGYASASSLTA
jgi:hypothetical protein